MTYEPKKCPCCGSDWLLTTCLGYAGDGPDPNRWECQSCGYKWREHDPGPPTSMVALQEVECCDKCQLCISVGDDGPAFPYCGATGRSLEHKPNRWSRPAKGQRCTWLNPGEAVTFYRRGR